MSVSRLVVAVVCCLLLVASTARAADVVASEFEGLWYTVSDSCTPGSSLGTCCCSTGVWNITAISTTQFTFNSSLSGGLACQGASEAFYTYTVVTDRCPYPAHASFVNIATVTISLVTTGQIQISNSFLTSCISYACKNLSDPVTCPKAFGSTPDSQFTDVCETSSSSTGSTDVTVYDTSPFVGTWKSVDGTCTAGDSVGECCCYSGGSTVTSVGTNLINMQTGVTGGGACLLPDPDVPYLAANFTVVSATSAVWTVTYLGVTTTVTMALVPGTSQFIITPAILETCKSYGCKSLDNTTTCPAIALQSYSSSSTGAAAAASSTGLDKSAAMATQGSVLLAMLSVIAVVATILLS